MKASGQHCVFAVGVAQLLYVCTICAVAPHSHALSGQRHKVAPSWSLASDFPGLDAHFSLIAWTSDTSLVLHFQSSLCTVVAVHTLRSLESAELYVLLGRNIASPAKPCSIVWVVVQMTVQVLEPCSRHCDTACRCRARLTSSMRFVYIK